MNMFFRLLTAFLGISGFLWLAGLVLFTVQVYSAKPLYPNKKTDAIIVLTGGNFRVETGMKLWSENQAKNMLITGVYKDVRQEELLSEWQNKMRLPECCLTLGYQAATTEENATEAKAWAKENNIRSARIVTSGYHMPRALLEFKLAMPDIKLYLHPVEIEDYKPAERIFWYLVILEYHKYLWRHFEWFIGYELETIRTKL